MRDTCHTACCTPSAQARHVATNIATARPHLVGETAGTGFVPGVAVPVQGIRSSARLAAAGPTNPFSTTGITPAATLLIPHAAGSL